LFNESSYEQTPAMRQAVDIVAGQIKDGEHRRDEIAKVVLSISSEANFDAVALANLTLAKMAERRGEISG
jgi:hypothetical protein